MKLKFNIILLILYFLSPNIPRILGQNLRKDIYVNNLYNQTPLDGTKTRPFKTVKQAFDLLASIKEKISQINIYISPSLEEYQGVMAGRTLRFESITITSWKNDNPIPCRANNCPDKPIVWTESIDTHLYGIKGGLIRIADLILVARNGYLQTYVADLELENIEIRGPFNKYHYPLISYSNGEKITVNNLKADNIGDEVFLYYDNSWSDVLPKTFRFSDIQVSLNVEKKVRDYKLEPFITLENKNDIDKLIIERISVQGAGNLPSSFRPFMLVKNINQAFISDFSMNNLAMTDVSNMPLIKFEKSKYIEINSFSLEKNKINWESITPLLQFPFVDTIKIKNNQVLSNSIFVKELNNFIFAEISDSKNFNLENSDLKNNLFQGNVEFWKITYRDSWLLTPKKLKVSLSHLRVTQNSYKGLTDGINELPEFNYLSIKGAYLDDSSIAEINFSQNMLPGSFLDIQCGTISKLDSQSILKNPSNILKITKINILDNPNMFASTFLELSSSFDSEEKANVLQMIPPYIVKFSESFITKNKLVNSRTDDLLSQASLFNIKESQLHLDNVEIADNEFYFYNLIELEDKPSTLIINSCIFRDNNFVASQLIKSDYLSDFQLTFIGKDQIDSSIALYCFTFFINSRFENLHISSSSFISASNGYLLLRDNLFENITLKDSVLLEHDFVPIPFLGSVSKYSSNSTIENLLLSKHRAAQDFFAKVSVEAKSYQGNNVYFISIEENCFKKINLNNSKVLVIKNFDFNQTFIQVRDNDILTIENKAKFATAFCDINSFKILAILNNKIDLLMGDLTAFSLPSGKTSQFLKINSNQITEKLSSFLLYNGLSIENIEFQSNTFTDVQFLRNFVSLQVFETTKDWILNNNIFSRSSLRETSSDYQGKDTIGFINVKVQKSNNKLFFKDNNFKEVDSLKFYQGYHFIHFQTTQSIIFDNLAVKDCKLMIPLITVLNSPFTILQHSTIHNLKGKVNQAILSIISSEIIVKNVTGSSLEIESAAGFFSLDNVKKPKDWKLKISDSSFSFNAFPIETSGGFIQLKENKNTLEEPYHIEMINTTVITIQQSPIIHFSNILCQNCVIKNCTLGVVKNSLRQVKLRSLFEFDQKTQGRVTLSELIFTFSAPMVKPIISIIGSPISVEVNSLRFNGSKTHFQFVSMDSGSLAIRNSIFENIKMSYNSFINIAPDATQTNKKYESSLVPKVVLNSTVFRGIAGPIQEMDIFDFMQYSFNYQYNYEPIVTSAIISSYTPSQISIGNTTFENIQAMPAILLGSAESSNFPETNKGFLKINNSKFRNIFFYTGSALTVFSNNLLSFVQIENSQFEENKAFIGGSLLVYNVKLNVSKSNFQNNTALIIGATTFIGGETMRLSKFTKNSYLNNTAYYEGDIRSEAEDIKVSFVSDVSTGIKATKPKDPNVSLALQNVSSPALRKGEFIVSFIDKEGRGTPDFSLMKHIVSELPQNKEDKLKFSFDAESVSFSELSANYTLGNIVIFDRAKAVVPLQIKYSSERFSAEKQVLLSFRECYIGEENNTQTFACESCKAGTYSFEAGKHCLKCPEKAKCPGKSEIIPNPGYWNTERNPSDIITCRDDGTLRCTNLGGEKNCATGYKGPLCEACDFDNSYVETGYLKCGICKDPKTSLIISILFGVVYFGYQIFSIKTFYSANRQIQSEQSDAKTQRKFERSFYLESFLTYTQLISSIYSSTTNNIHQTLGLTAKIGDPSALITYGTQCSMLVFGIEKSDLIFFRMYFIVFQPIFQIIVILLFLSLVKLCKKTLSMNRIIPIVILYFIISYQPGLVSNLATFQSCKTLKGLGYDYIAAHPSWDCNSEQYLRISSHLAMPALIIWCIIIPLLILFGLLGYRKYSAEKLNNVFGMLVYNVKSEYYYWGLVLMALKLLLTFISLVLKDQISLQIFASLLVIWCYQFLVRKWKPYVNKLFNNLEVIIMNLVMFNMIATKYFITPENSAFMSYTFIVLCIVLNGGLILFSAWRIFTLTAKDVLHYHEKAKSWLQKRKEKKKSELEEKLELAT